MRKLLLACAITASMFQSCTKTETDNKDKPTSTQGTIRFTNTSTNPYSIYINGGILGSVQGKKFYEVNKEAGSYTLKAKQESGYALYPTEVEIYINLSAGQEKEFVFPY